MSRLLPGFLPEEQVCILNEAPLNLRISHSQQRRISMERYIWEGIQSLRMYDLSFQELRKLTVDLQLKIMNHHENGEEESDICSICQAEYEGGERIGVLRCGHQFHCDCIRGWLALKNVCPLCRSSTIDHL